MLPTNLTITMVSIIAKERVITAGQNPKNYVDFGATCFLPS